MYVVNGYWTVGYAIGDLPMPTDKVVKRIDYYLSALSGKTIEEAQIDILADINTKQDDDTNSLLYGVLIDSKARKQYVILSDTMKQYQVDQVFSVSADVDLTGYALKTELPSLTGYALKTELPDLTPFATQTWVSGSYALSASLVTLQDNLTTNYPTFTDVNDLYETVSSSMMAQINVEMDTRLAGYATLDDVVPLSPEQITSIKDQIIAQMVADNEIVFNEINYIGTPKAIIKSPMGAVLDQSDFYEVESGTGTYRFDLDPSQWGDGTYYIEIEMS